MRRIAIVTGSRAEYGLLSPLIKQLHQCDDYDVQLIVCATHLLAEFGSTGHEIAQADCPIAAEVDMLLANDSAECIAKSIGLGVIEFSSHLKRLQPDAVIVLGDRFEIFAAVQAAFSMHIPIFHLHGGELTFGALDEGYRHAITKMSHVHFVACELYRQRVIQMGEQPSRVYNVGAIGLDNINQIALCDRDTIEKTLAIKFSNQNFLVTLHPSTMHPEQLTASVDAVLQAIREFPDDCFIFTKSNADEGGRLINDMIESFCKHRDSKCYCFASLGNQMYLNMLKQVDAVIGNSSSGIIEAPFCGVPTINIGDRQQGREQADSIINCEFDSNEIISAINKSVSDEFKAVARTPQCLFGKGDTSRKILSIINKLDPAVLLKKQFYDLGAGDEGCRTS